MEKSEDPLMKPVTERYPDHQLLVKGAFVTAVTVGIGGAVNKIWELFYNNWKDSSLVADLRAARERAQAELEAKLEAAPMHYADSTAAKKAIEDTWGKAFNARIKNHLGIESEGLGVVKGTWQRFNSLGDYTRSNIVFSTVLSTAAAIGGYMLINQNAHLKRDQQLMQDRLDQEQHAREATKTGR